MDNDEIALRDNAVYLLDKCIRDIKRNYDNDENINLISLYKMLDEVMKYLLHM